MGTFEINIPLSLSVSHREVADCRIGWKPHFGPLPPWTLVRFSDFHFKLVPVEGVDGRNEVANLKGAGWTFGGCDGGVASAVALRNRVQVVAVDVGVGGLHLAQSNHLWYPAAVARSQQRWWKPKFVQ